MSTPTGPISLAQQNLRLSLADSTAWRSWVDATTQEQALNRIHLIGLPPADDDFYTRIELETKRPYAIVAMAPEGGFMQRALASGATRTPGDSGVLLLTIADDVPQEIESNLAELDMRFLNNVGAVLDDMWDVNGTGGYLAFSEVGVLLGPYRAVQEAQSGQGDWVGIDLRFNWGVSG